MFEKMKERSLLKQMAREDALLMMQTLNRIRLHYPVGLSPLEVEFYLAMMEACGLSKGKFSQKEREFLRKEIFEANSDIIVTPGIRTFFFHFEDDIDAFIPVFKDDSPLEGIVSVFIQEVNKRFPSQAKDPYNDADISFIISAILSIATNVDATMSSGDDKKLEVSHVDDDIKYCYKCGHELEADALFCEKCGTRVR